MSNIRVRIAPSPTGYPHIGTIFQALINYVYAKKHQGKFLVRIEDTDQSRLVDDAEDAIFSALEWFDLNPDESPRHASDFGPFRQSERLEIYHKYANQLLENGHAYRCFCTKDRLDQVRKDMQKNGLPPMYDKKCRNLNPEESKKRAKNEDHVIRMKVPKDQKISFIDEIRGQIEFDSSVVDDQVIIKSDGFPTYHLAVVVDDHLMEITHMVRGEEWISSAPKHILLYQYFGWDLPKFIHSPVLRNPDKSKLSKRHGHASVNWYIDNGYLKEAILNFLITRVWNHPEGKEIFGIDEMIKHFEFKDMHIQGPIVDLKKLDWINGQWIRQKTDKELVELLQAHKSNNLSNDMLERFLPLVKERLHKLSDIIELTEYLYQNPVVDQKKILKESKSTTPELVAYLESVKEVLINISDFDSQNLESKLRDLQVEVGWKPRAAFMSIRLAITGQPHTPPLFNVMAILGKDLIIDRLSHVIKEITQN